MGMVDIVYFSDLHTIKLYRLGFKYINKAIITHCFLPSGWMRLNWFILGIFSYVPKLMAEFPPLLMWLPVGVNPYWLSLTSFLHCYEMVYITWYYFSRCFYYYFKRLRYSSIFYLHFFIKSFFQQPFGSGYEQHYFPYNFYISFKMVFQILLSYF